MKISLFVFSMALIGLVVLADSDFKNLPSIAATSGNMIRLGDEQIRVLQKGSGDDILLVHGSPGSIEDWNYIVDSLAKYFRVTAFDRPGHGFSSANNMLYSIGKNADIIEKLTHKLDLKSPLIVGHSYGGSIAAFMALHSELDVKGYVIIDSPLYSYDCNDTYTWLSIPMLGEALSLLSSFTIANTKIEEEVSTMFEAKGRKEINILVNERKKLWSQPKVIYSKANEAVNYQDDLRAIYPFYQMIQKRITIITGLDSTHTFKPDCVRFFKDVENAELFELPNTGHYLQIDQSLEVIEILKFIRMN